MFALANCQFIVFSFAVMSLLLFSYNHLFLFVLPLLPLIPAAVSGGEGS